MNVLATTYPQYILKQIVVPGGLLSVSGSLSVTGNTLHLVNDQLSPGPNYVYGTDGSGNKGWIIGGGGGTWGSITGTLSSQTDLQTALNAKQGTLISGNGTTYNSGNPSVDLGGALTQVTNITGAFQIQLSNFNAYSLRIIPSSVTLVTNSALLDLLATPITYSATSGSSYHLRISDTVGAFGANNTEHHVLELSAHGSNGGFTGTKFVGINYQPIVTAATHYAAIFASGSIGIGTTTPTASVHIGAGTSTQGPLKLTAGTNVTTLTGNVQDGLMEYDGSHLSFIIGSTRYQIDRPILGNGNGTTYNTGNTAVDLGGALASSPLFTGTGTVTFRNNSAGTVVNISPTLTLTSGTLLSLSPSLSVSGTGTGTAHFGINGTTTTTITGNNTIHKFFTVESTTVSYGSTTGSSLYGFYYNPTITGTGSITHYAAVFGSGMVGIGTLAPTSLLNIAAGTATVAPIKLTSGTNLTTTQAGAIEFDGTHFYGTITNGGTRFQLDQQSGGGFITSLTTTGTSGAATVTSGVLNIPQYGGGISGLTAGRITLSTGASTIGDNSGFTYNTSLLTQTISGSAASMGYVVNNASSTGSSYNQFLNNASSQLQIGKFGATQTTVQAINSSDAYLYNGPTGNITIQNGNSSGNVNIAAGNSATPQLTVTSSGAVLVNTATDDGVNKFQVNGGIVGNTLTANQVASTGTVRSSLINIGGAHTALTASTDYNDVSWDFSATAQFSTGAIANLRTTFIKARTYSAVGATTITTAATKSISGPPKGGTNVTITNSVGYLVEASALTNVTNGYAAFFNAPSGASVNYALGLNGNISMAGNILLNTIGSGVQVKEGTNARQGVATLASGTITVANTSITANTRILITPQETGTLTGFLRVSARTAGTSFTISSSVLTDTVAVAWFLSEGI